MINGNADFYNSGLNLNSSIYIKGNLILNDVITRLSENSTIYVSECLSISNATFVVNDNDDELSANDTFSIIDANSACSNITDANLVLISSLSCKKVTTTTALNINGLKFQVSFDNSECSTKTELTPLTKQSWFTPTIIVIVLFALSVMIISIVFLCPSLKKRILPYNEAPPDIYSSTPPVSS